MVAPNHRRCGRLFAIPVSVNHGTLNACREATEIEIEAPLHESPPRFLGRHDRVPTQLTAAVKTECSEDDIWNLAFFPPVHHTARDVWTHEKRLRGYYKKLPWSKMRK